MNWLAREPRRSATRAFGMVGLAVLALACKGPSVPSTVTGEPVCEGFDQAGQHMRGGLKQPVQLHVLKGSEIIATVMIYGKSGQGAPPTRFLLPGAGEEYTVEWTQCPNERAPSPHDPNDKKANQGAPYECQPTEPYSTAKHTTKSGEASTFELALPAVPVADCLAPLGAK